MNERYALEWLRGLRAAGYLEQEPDGRFTLPAEHAQVLAVEGGPFFLGGAYEVTFGYLQPIARLIEAFRDGRRRTAVGLSRARPARYVPLHAPVLRPPARPAVGAGDRRAAGKLERGVRWADVGCGAGWR